MKWEPQHRYDRYEDWHGSIKQPLLDEEENIINIKAELAILDYELGSYGE